ncbi:ER lumen protein-retaining receptor-like [Zophobas morio]|uniref:ER lumen protein-retaining receptor-like n=1 Tax=Zophobas morio TaxID=2755281 RepID=UPI003083AE47
MNIFRLLGDLSHLVAILLLLHKITSSRSVSGLSLHSQVLFLIVFISRYLDLFTTFISLYNSVMKVIFIATSALVCYDIAVKHRNSYKEGVDNIPYFYTITPCILLALIFKRKFTILEVLWTFSEFLEAIAIFPQLDMIQTTGEAESITSHYLFFLGLYRALYIPNWIYRYYTEKHHLDLISVIPGIVQTALYIDFFYLYITKVLSGRKLVLPA